MAIPNHHKENFEMMLQAFQHGHLALLQCKDIKTGEAVTVICANFRDKQGRYNQVPFAKMFTGNPYEEVSPPETFDKEDYIMRAMKFLEKARPIQIANLMEEFFVSKSPKSYKRVGIYLARKDIEPTLSQLKSFFAMQDDLPIEPFLDFIDDKLLELEKDEEKPIQKG